MRRLTQQTSQLNIQLYLYEAIAGLKQAQQKERNLTKAAFLIRDWVSAICSFPGRKVLLQHDSYTLPGLLMTLQTYRGGVWCGGCAKVLSETLRACQIPAVTYGYGPPATSHITVIFSPDQRKNYYVLDAYLNYHYVYKGSTEMIPLAEMFSFIRKGRYSAFERVDTPLKTRHLVTAMHETAVDFAWLFDDGVPTKPDRVVNERRLYSGVSHSVDKVFAEGCDYRLRIDEARGKQSLDEYVLDQMLCDLYIGRARQAHRACYPDITVLRYFVQALADRRD